MKEQTVVSVDPGVAIPRLTARIWEQMQKATVNKETGEVTFCDGKVLYAGPMTKKETSPEWSLDEPMHPPEDFYGPFKLMMEGWERIEGGVLLERRALIVKGKQVFRLASVVIKPAKQMAKQEAPREVYRAAVYAPVALGLPRRRPPRTVPGDITVVPAISRQLWAGMEVGGWHEGGWLSRKDREHRFLHLDGSGGKAQWVLRRKEPTQRGTVFPMSRDDWNRISCGTLVTSKNLIIKDGRALRVVAVKAGDNSAAVTYAPLGLKQLPKMRAGDAVEKK